ncbi:MAG: 8-amino-7-oxononanoate synthase [Deltaproteobacteria bacterium]|nr:8-amino-7-oxononanoate synthase [Deltaproteobacteria bacterium]
MAGSPDPEDFLAEALHDLEVRGLRRTLRCLEPGAEGTARVDGRPALVLASNDYLGLAGHPRLIKAAREALETHGCGATASRLIAGTWDLHLALEAELARFMGCEAALLFNSGYTANVGLFQALADRGDCLFSDALNHASIIDGCRLSRAEVVVYPHRDVDALARLLRERRGARRRFVVTEGIFSMDGDAAPLAAIAKLARREHAFLIVDEAHALGVIGPDGRGACAAAGVEAEAFLRLGTLGKALGCFGAFVAGSRRLREFLINRCRSLIFTTALPPVVVAACREAVRVAAEQPGLRERLWTNARYLRAGLEGLGYTVGGGSQILPVMTYEPGVTMALSEALLERGVYVQGIRPPTVPPGSCRLRVTPTAAHMRADLDRALAAFAAAGRAVGLLR